MLCIMQNHIVQAFANSGNAIKPVSFIRDLRSKWVCSPAGWLRSGVGGEEGGEVEGGGGALRPGVTRGVPMAVHSEGECFPKCRVQSTWVGTALERASARPGAGAVWGPVSRGGRLCW